MTEKQDPSHSKFTLLVNGLRALSHNAQTLTPDDIFAQWTITKIVEDEEYGLQCLCKTLIQKQIHLQNIFNYNQTIIGRICAKKYIKGHFKVILDDIEHQQACRAGISKRDRTYQYWLCPDCQAIMKIGEKWEHDKWKHTHKWDISILNQTFEKGKHKYKSLRQVLQSDLSYINWLIKENITNIGIIVPYLKAYLEYHKWWKLSDTCPFGQHEGKTYETILCTYPAYVKYCIQNNIHSAHWKRLQDQQNRDMEMCFQ